MNLLPFQLAWRFLRAKHKEKTISLMMKICFAGITIGSFSLMLTLIITNGFEKTIFEKMQGINAEIILTAFQKLDAPAIERYLFENFKEIEAVSPSSTRQLLVDKNKKQTLLFLKGIEPENENKVTNLSKKIIQSLDPQNNLENIVSGNQILIGDKFAKQFGLEPGDELNLLIPETGSSKNKIFLNKEKAVVGGIFKIGLDEYDSGFAYCNLDFLRKVFENEEGVDQIAIRLKPQKKQFNLKRFFSLDFYKNIFQINEYNALVADKLRKDLIKDFSIYTWQELYPALVLSLKLEKYVMFLIIALISFVASMNMISLLFLQIQQKKKNIAIFKAMGMSSKTIQTIFLSIGLLITFLGSVVGLCLATFVGYFLEKYPFIELPDVYYVSHLPARVDFETVFVVFVCTIFLGFIATLIPATRSKRINIIEVLRSE